MEKRKVLKVFFICLIVLLIISIGVTIYFIKEEKNKVVENNLLTQNSGVTNESTTENVTKTKEEVKKYVLDDYVKIENKTIETNPASIVKYVNVTNLPEGLTVEFKKMQDEFITPKAMNLENFKYTNEVSSEIIDNILSIYVAETSTPNEGLGPQYSDYSLNVDLATNKLILNEEMLKVFKFDSKDMFKKILTSISENVTTDSFLISTTGDITAEKIAISDFKNKINTYAESISNRTDIITLYIKDGKLNATFKQINILNALGMGTHMGIGLKSEIQTIII